MYSQRPYLSPITGFLIILSCLLNGVLCGGERQPAASTAQVNKTTTPDVGVRLKVEENHRLSVALTTPANVAECPQVKPHTCANVFGCAINKGTLISATEAVVVDGRVLLRRVDRHRAAQVAHAETGGAPNEKQQVASR